METRGPFKEIFRLILRLYWGLYIGFKKNYGRCNGDRNVTAIGEYVVVCRVFHVEA